MNHTPNQTMHRISLEPRCSGAGFLSYDSDCLRFGFIWREIGDLFR